MTLDAAYPGTLLVYGGSFDPPHRAHVELPHAAAHELGARILYIPAGQPPHKSRQVTPAEHRLAMLRLALRGSQRASVCELELHRSGKSYTVDTLEELRRMYPRATLRLLIGSDMAAIFYQWRQPRRILQLAEPLVMMRTPLDVAGLLASLPADLSADERQAWADRVIAAPLLDVSSTELRTLLATGDSRNPRLAQLLDPAVIDYIAAHRLYRSDAPAASAETLHGD